MDSAMSVEYNTTTPKRVAILGSTGSIGRQTLDVIASQDDLYACGLAAGSGWQLLASQAEQFGPEAVALADEEAAERILGELPDGIDLLGGPEAMTELVRAVRPDIVLSGVVGAAGLRPTLAAIECGATLAIANKETLVMAGAIVMPAARAANLPVLPVDSEHSAIFQCLASWDEARAAEASVDEALNHPTWEMGPKITIDSATLVNKALEVVEAHWLFDLPPEQIDVVIHPESIVHSYVEFCDGSVIAQMGLPDMTTPIAYALNHPARALRNVAPLDLAEVGTLSFARPEGRFARAVNLGFEAIRRGGAAGAILNSANEAAVEAFIDGKIAFGQIVPLVEEILNRSEPMKEVTLDGLLSADAWARREVGQAVSVQT